MNFDKNSLLLYVVTDRAWLCSKRLENEVEAAIRGGATMVQLREKDMTDAQFLAEARKIKAVTDRFGIPFIINDNIAVALECGADGVHVGQRDMQAQKVRSLLGPNKILGVSAGSVEQALAAQRAGADYLGVGAVFTTSTKKDAKAVSYATLQQICSAVSIPVVAIGGITEQNLLQLQGSGIAGVAVVSAIFAQSDVCAAAQRLRPLAAQL